MDEKTIARFWKNVDKRGEAECWNWVGFRRKDSGFGQVSVERHGRALGTRVQVVSWAIHTKEWPRKRVEVTCGNITCVNPSHLVLHQNKVAIKKPRREPRVVTVECEHCGKRTQYPASYVRHRGTRFCSNKCAALNRYSDNLVDRFWSRVDRRGTDDCWDWTGPLVPDGYGDFSVAPSRIREMPFDVSPIDPDRPRKSRSVSMGSHRVAWALTHGQWPALHVLHACDRPRCCNPNHMSLGTHTDNMRDRQRKGRHANAVLDADKVRSVRRRAESGEHYAAIARSMGIDPEQIRRVISGDRWRFVS